MSATKQQLNLRRFLVLATLALACTSSASIYASLPRTAINAPPLVLGREVKELVLVGTVHVGRTLPPGLPTTTTYKMTPNRFRPIAEDAEGVFYQAVGPLQKHMPMSLSVGGVYMSKANPDKLVPYRGDALNSRLPLGMWEPLHPAHAQKFRLVFRGSEKAARKQGNSG